YVRSLPPSNSSPSTPPSRQRRGDRPVTPLEVTASDVEPPLTSDVEPRRGGRARSGAWVWWLPVLTAALVASVGWAVTIGPADLSVREVWQVIGAKLGLVDSTLSPIRAGIVWELR